YDKEDYVDSAIQILQELATSSESASVQAALGRAYLYKLKLTHDPKWAVPAAAACERGLRNDPENFELHVTLGQLRRETGRGSDEAVRKGDRTSPRQSSCTQQYRRHVHQRGMLPRGGHNVSRVVEKTANFASLFKLGDLLLRNGTLLRRGELLCSSDCDQPK